MQFDRQTLSALRAQLTAHVLFGMRTAAEAVVHNKLRAGLTSLGILFGVASVIAMLAIGRGAKQEILAQMALLGSNNIVIGVFADRLPGRAIVVSASDNLVKGASGQAIQNMNVMLGIDETAGLRQEALFP